MRKRILALISATAIVALAFGATPHMVAAATTYDYYISLDGVADNTRNVDHQNCSSPYSHYIQDALDEYASGDTIFICAGTYEQSTGAGSFNYQEPLVASHGSVTIVGAGAGSTILVGDDSGDRVLTVTGAGHSLTIQGLTIENSTSDYGGGAAFVEDGAFTCLNAAFADNAADTNGGAVYVDGDFTTTGCTFGATNRGNTSIDGDGGAVIVSGGGHTATCTNSTFLDNGAEFYGGAIAVYGATNLVTTGCTFGSPQHGNHADGDSGGAISMDNGDFTCVSSTFVDNHAAVNAGAVDVPNGTAKVTKCTFGAASHGNTSGGDGGALVSSSDFTCSASTFIGNAADSNGGAAYVGGNASLTKCTFTNNYADAPEGYSGGALFLEGNFNCTSSTFSRNYATSNGGAAYVAGGTRSNKCTYTSNTAESNGGAIWSELAMNDVSGTYTNNVAGEAGGAVLLAGSNAARSAFTKSTFTGNHTCGFSAAAFAAETLFEEDCVSDASDLPGGGAIATDDSPLYIYSSKFTNNGSVVGGAILQLYAYLYVERSVFNANASIAGGAILSGVVDPGSYGWLELNRNTFKLNHAYAVEGPESGFGGAFAAGRVRFTKSSLVASGNVFAGNIADGVSPLVGFPTDAGLVGLCEHLDLVTGNTSEFEHGVLPKSLGYWADGAFWAGSQTISYLDACTDYLAP
jgi:hypothetical protein